RSGHLFLSLAQPWKEIEHLFHSSGEIIGLARREGAEPQILRDRHIRENLASLGHVGDTRRRNLVGCAGGKIDPGENDDSARSWTLPRNRAQDRALARGVGADDANQSA